MNIKTETSFVNRSKDVLLLLPSFDLAFDCFVSINEAMDAKMEPTEMVEKMRRGITWREAEREEDRELSDTKASLHGGLDLTSILGRVHSRRRRREESVPSARARVATTRFNVSPD